MCNFRAKSSDTSGGCVVFPHPLRLHQGGWWGHQGWTTHYQSQRGWLWSGTSWESSNFFGAGSINLESRNLKPESRSWVQWDRIGVFFVKIDVIKPEFQQTTYRFNVWLKPWSWRWWSYVFSRGASQGNGWKMWICFQLKAFGVTPAFSGDFWRTWFAAWHNWHKSLLQLWFGQQMANRRFLRFF